MRELRYPLEVFAVMTAATVACRAFPFLVPRRVQESRRLHDIGDTLPAAVMLLLVVYCLKDAGFSAPPYGAPELLCAALVVALHLWRRNSLLSIGAGTGVYVALVRSGLFSRLFAR
jgi:branched-subunit amino acid transport protein AzlD